MPFILVAAAVIVLLVVASGTSMATRLNASSSSASDSRALQPDLPQGGFPVVPNPECNYTVFLSGSTLAALASSGAMVKGSGGSDLGAFLNPLLASYETLCVAAGSYTVSTQIEIDRLHNVTLKLDSAAVLRATSGNRLLLVIASPGTVVSGGQWIGPGRDRVSVITLQYGSNDSVVEGTDVSRGGVNGILIYDNVRPSFGDSILNNFVHDNARYGIQEYSNTSAGMTGTVISGNVVLDNEVGGIYTNAVSGVTIANNVVRNTAGNGPGEIGIGVTNGYNDTVTLNHVEHMAWFGIQAYYNNFTVISNNISVFNAGGEDESGITNDHSSFNTIAGNVVVSNGRYGVYVERSWNVTVSENVANENGGYGIGLYHGSLPVMGGVAISGNTCSFNGLGGIVLNSAIESVISMNQCYNNSGDGILLYNDVGQSGSTGNVVSGNWLGNEPGLPPTQTFGIAEGNQSDNNTVVSNIFVNNTMAATSLVGGDATASP